MSDTTGTPAKPPLAHVMVYPSLHAWNRTASRLGESAPNVHPMPGCYAGFASHGLTYLNQLVCPQVTNPTVMLGDWAGLPVGYTTVLIGDPSTFKSRLARAFLAGALTSDPEKNVALLLSTQQIDKLRLCEQLKSHGAADNCERRTFCRQIDLHYISSSSCLHIVKYNIIAAQKLICDTIVSEVDKEAFWQQASVRREYSWRIRLVLDDWQTLLDTHPRLADDALFLESLLTLLRTEGVTSLIVTTGEGSPAHRPASQSGSHELRNIDTRFLYAWPVRFFGERRVAITTAPAVQADQQPLIYELRPARIAGGLDSELLEIDRHFALYSGLEVDRPEKIPLRVKLYSGNQTTDDLGKQSDYLRRVREGFSQLFAVKQEDEKIVFDEPIDKYDRLADFADLLDNSRLDHSLVLQVDEFWRQNESSLEGIQSLADLKDYFDAVTCKQRGATLTAITEEDTSQYFQPHAVTKKDKDYRRKDFFTSQVDRHDLRFRTPYIFDFGFLLARTDLWRAASALPVDKDPNQTIGGMFELLSIYHVQGNDRAAPEVSWTDFFRACRVVGQRAGTPAFEVDNRSGETLCSLVLEIWASEVRASFSDLNADLFPDDESTSLCNAVEDYAPWLFLAIAELFTAAPELVLENNEIALRSATGNAAAARHWYSTACSAAKHNHWLSPMRLPGSFSVRGDWSLAVGSGSRSKLLACRALDVLTSRRMNLLRLQDGVGLPVRDIMNINGNPVATELIRTGMPLYQSYDETTYPVLLGELLRLGAQPGTDFYWIRRSKIRRYDRQVFYFRRWLGRLRQDMSDLLPEPKQEYIKTLRDKINTSVSSSKTDPNKTAHQRHTEVNQELRTSGDPALLLFYELRDVFINAVRRVAR